MAGRFQTVLCKGVQLIPRKDNIVAVHQQIFGQNFPLLGIKIRAFPLLHRAECRQRVPFDGAIGALEDFEQLGILFQCCAVSRCPALGHGLRLLLRAFAFSPAAVHMHVAAHLIPRHHKARAMGTEHRICRVVKVVLRLVAHGFNDLRRIVAGR